MIQWSAILFLTAAIGLLLYGISEVVLVVSLTTQIILFASIICLFVVLILLLTGKMQGGA